MDNFWDITKKCMILSSKNEYEMGMTINEQNFKLVFITNIQSIKATETSVPFILNEDSKVPANMTSRIKFILGPKGLKIGQAQAYLAAEKDIDHGKSSPLVVSYTDNDDSLTQWTFKHAG